jgi:uncharacterized protein YjiS (DUF1127 family)
MLASALPRGAAAASFRAFWAESGRFWRARSALAHQRRALAAMTAHDLADLGITDAERRAELARISWVWWRQTPRNR